MPQKTKRSTQHHLRVFHKIRMYSFAGLIASLLAIQYIAGLQVTAPQTVQPEPQSEVLAYATAISVGDLFAATNQARANNGLGSLALSAKLNNGAQAKANDMIAKNYWSHNAPDGTQPWAFFANASYSYSRAGENLAYGFDTSGGVVNGWMNSPGHKANIIGSYQDVGFGIANGPTYQGGENTVIVAFYGTPQTVAAAPVQPAPKPAAPAPAPTPKPAAVAPAPTPPPAPAPEPVKPEAPPAEVKKEEPVAEEPKQEAKKVTNFESILNGQANWAMYASLGALGITSVGFAGTHIQLVRRGWRQSRHYILVHPAIDTAVLAAIGAAILTSASGFIR